MDTPYRPIACIEHERLEFAVLKRQPLALVCLLDDGATWRGEVLPLDVYTREGAEWLRARAADGRERTVRLDHILSAEVQPR